MKIYHLEKLELPAILGRVAKHASFSAGKESALRLTPSSDLEEVRYLQKETAEARRLLEIKPDFSLGGVHDVRPLVDNALRGARLPPQDLLNIRDTLRRSRILQRSMSKVEEQFPHIMALIRQLDTCPELVDEIERCISERGDVLDRASPTLARTRSELGVAYDRLMDKLNRIMANPQYTSHLQEAYITQRDGRYVIPVKTDAKRRLPGLVHDQSASGATSFIEPLATVELNNKYRELQLAEEREIERILLTLSGQVAEAAAEIEYTVKIFARLDMVLAKAKYADSIRATMPEMIPFQSKPSKKRGNAEHTRHPGSAIKMHQARHPLLDPKTVVPIDVDLGDDYFVIVITGPNTGGKTVSLKTVGLLALMAQCGLHLPVEDGAELTVFENICADIGDEQSIEQSLSTFSSHMSHIIQILELVDDRSLVLLDELGAGTDPLEGAALAQSLLTHLIQRQVTTLATTHYPDLKMFAHETRGVTNACVEFDLETLAPTYQLTIGLPGHSNAFAIAERLGLPSPIVRRAQGLTTSSHLDTERFLAQIKETRSQTAQAQVEVETARTESLNLATELRARLAGIEREREEILNQARNEAASELEVIRRELRAARRRQGMAKADSSKLSKIEAKLDGLAKARAPDEPAMPELPQSIAGAIEVGDTVWVADLNATGKVLDIDDQAAEVQVGSFRVRTRIHSLEFRHKAPDQHDSADDIEIMMPPAPAISYELHLRGLRVEDALGKLEKYLDDAYRTQAPFVRIVHGKGTGTLRKAVRQFLQEHPTVSSFRSGAEGEGDTGVTVVKFTNS